MSPYVNANGRTPSTEASTMSVRSERPRKEASASSPTPATRNRMPAPSSGGVSPSPTLIATQVLDQMATSSAYRDQTETRLIGASDPSRRTAILRELMSSD